MTTFREHSETSSWNRAKEVALVTASFALSLVCVANIFWYDGSWMTHLLGILDANDPLLLWVPLALGILFVFSCLRGIVPRPDSAVMTAISPLTWLFAKQKTGRSRWDVIQWWEKRRAIYLLILIASCAHLSHLHQSQFDLTTTSLILIWTSNIWYTGGWFIELLLRSRKSQKLLWFAPVAFALGIVFSYYFSASFLSGPDPPQG